MNQWDFSLARVFTAELSPGENYVFGRARRPRALLPYAPHFRYATPRWGLASDGKVSGET